MKAGHNNEQNQRHHHNYVKLLYSQHQYNIRDYFISIIMIRFDEPSPQ